MIYLLFYFVSVFQVQDAQPQFREKLEWKSTLLENNKKGKYTLLQDSLGEHYKVKWSMEPDYPNFILLFVRQEETNNTIHLTYTCIGKPSQFYTGNFFNPWVDVP